jgi:hypothetical protein
MIRVVITGCRRTNDVDAVRRGLRWVIDEWYSDWPTAITWVHGKATGADAIADRLLRDWGFEDLIEEHPADWERYGKRAGPIRNGEMVALPDVSLIAAFPSKRSEGTWDCVKQGAALGITGRWWAVR